MKKIFLLIILVFISGCANGNFSPQMDQRIENRGKIDEIKNNQNGIMLELGRLKNDAQIIDSKLQEVQQGMINLNAAISKNENSGIQILQGDGALILVFSLGVIGLLLYYQKEQSRRYEAMLNLLAQEIAKSNDPELNDRIMLSVLNTENEKKVYQLMIKNSKNFNE